MRSNLQHNQSNRNPIAIRKDYDHSNIRYLTLPSKPKTWQRGRQNPQPHLKQYDAQQEFLLKKYLPRPPASQSRPTDFNTLLREVQIAIYSKVIDETARRLVLNQEFTKLQPCQHLPQFGTLIRINLTSRCVALSNYRLLFKGDCPFRSEKHYMYFNSDFDTLWILDWPILRSCWCWDIDLDFLSIKHVECETRDYMYVLNLFDHLDTIKVHWPIAYTTFERAYPELEGKMRDLKDDIEQWIEELHPERCKPEVEVVLSAETIASYKRKTPDHEESNSEYMY